MMIIWPCRRVFLKGHPASSGDGLFGLKEKELGNYCGVAALASPLPVTNASHRRSRWCLLLTL